MRWGMSGTSSKIRIDPTHYPVSDEMGEGSLQRFIAELLRPLVERYLKERGERAFVGADQYLYYEQYNPTKAVAPDVYVLPGLLPGLDVDCWKLWELGVSPSLAVEIVSGDRNKDIVKSPRRHAELGTRELIVFDPRARRGRERWRVYRRLARRGLVCAAVTDADRVRSRALGCWLRVVGSGASSRLRLATGARGDELFPTEAEAERAEREQAQVELRRAHAERERAEAERKAERIARERAEGEIASLRARLARRGR
jgi:hypothetical protein